MESTKAQAELLNAWIKANLGFVIILTHMVCSQVKSTKPWIENLGKIYKLKQLKEKSTCWTITGKTLL